jgi:ABC-2 type transport system permease protein
MTTTHEPDATGPPEPNDPSAKPVWRSPSSQLRVVSAQISVRQRLIELWRYRELLVAMTRKELKVKYKNSVLGFMWSLLNPATTLIVYYVVFQVVLHNNIPGFAIYLISGILVWNLFSTALPAACQSVVSNASIVKKVAFPREIPALAAVGAGLVHFFLQSLVLFAFLIYFHRVPAFEYVPLLLPALIALLLLTASLGVLLAAINVKLRDMTHLLEIGLTIWFWATPIIYQYRLVRDQVAKNAHSAFHWIFYLWRLNPVTPIVLAFQRSIYAVTSPCTGPCVAGQPVTRTMANGTKVTGLLIHILPDHAGPWWYLWQILLVILFSLLLFWYALRVFSRLEGNFAEDL